MKRIRSFYQKLSFTEKSAPLAFLAACILGFGLLIPSLGFYMDDWAYVFYSNLKGIDSLREMLAYDSRPIAAWLYILGFRVLGFSPLAWHFLTFILIVGTVITYWIFLRLIWTEQKQNSIYIALLFTVYPFFTLQSSPIGYTHLWFGFITFNLSLILMFISINKLPPIRWLLVILALSLEAVHLFTSEYFAGLELIRVVVLWILISRSELRFSKKVFGAALQWLPYLIVLAVFFYWRIFLQQNPEGITRNDPVILTQLISEPLKAINFLLTAFVSDTISVLTMGWQKAVDVSQLDLASPYFQFKLFVCVLGFLLAFSYIKKLLPHLSNKEDVPWRKEAFILASTALMASGLPIWIIGRSIVESKNIFSASRFGMPAMFGAALLTFLVMDYFISDKNKKAIFLAFIFALAINFHLDNARDYKYSWEKQERFAQQLIWRAPGLKPGTSLLTDQEVMGMMGEYAVSFSINTMYQVKNFGNTPPYWYFPFYYTNPNIGDLLQGVPLEYTKLSMQFKGSSKQILLLDFNPELNRCLWVLQPQDTNLRLVSNDMRQLSAGSNINLIQPVNGAEPTLPESIYGKQNKKTWCYYFEKADLARQYQQWDEVVRLWKSAQSNGERADNGFEYIPFIEGFGHAEDWEQVKTLTKSANRISAGLEPSLCAALDRITLNAPASQQRDLTVKGLKDDLNCANYQ
jgi:hypothetical protein